MDKVIVHSSALQCVNGSLPRSVIDGSILAIRRADCARQRCSSTVLELDTMTVRRYSTAVLDDGVRRRGSATGLGDGDRRRCSTTVLSVHGARRLCSTTVLSVRTNPSQPSRRPVPYVRLLIVAFHANSRNQWLRLVRPKDDT